MDSNLVLSVRVLVFCRAVGWQRTRALISLLKAKLQIFLMIEGKIEWPF